MDEKGMVNKYTRKLFFTDQKKQYMKHHKVQGILTSAITHVEFLKIVDKSSENLFEILCALLMKEISKLRRLSEISWFNNMSSSE
jgi:type VI protein secretion system component Hcp